MKLIVTKNENDEACVGVVANDFEIHSPRLSECGRFVVEPSMYGLTEDEADFLEELNKQLDHVAPNMRDVVVEMTVEQWNKGELP